VVVLEGISVRASGRSRRSATGNYAGHAPNTGMKHALDNEMADRPREMRCATGKLTLLHPHNEDEHLTRELLALARLLVNCSQ
jgi:hypothetical protein